jgi:hypothetical protein
MGDTVKRVYTHDLVNRLSERDQGKGSGNRTIHAAYRSEKSSERWKYVSTPGVTLIWNVARFRASFGPITLVNLSTVVLKSLAYICCNSTVIVTSNNPFSPSCKCCARCASKLPPSMRARVTSDRPLQEGHSSPRLLLMSSQSRQKTAVERGSTFSFE